MNRLSLADLTSVNNGAAGVSEYPRSASMTRASFKNFASKSLHALRHGRSRAPGKPKAARINLDA